MTRTEKILAAIDPSAQSGIEIGPLDRPIVTRDSGSVAYVDRACTDELRKWYRNDATVDIDKIVSVDYVWGETSFGEAVGAGKKFDYVVASHVIEHVPDLVGWFKEVAGILTPCGIVSLVVPDKRYTLDRLRRTTTGAELIDAYLCRLRKPSPRQIFDHFSLVVEADAPKIWSRASEDRHLKKMYTPALALDACRDSVHRNTYIDSHCWVFTPDAFFQNVALLIELDLFDFEVIRFFNTNFGENEFFVAFRKPDDTLQGREKRSRQLHTLPARSDIPNNLEELHRKLEDCLHAIASHQRMISEITQSTTWRVTAPFRSAAERVKSFFRRLRRIGGKRWSGTIKRKPR